MDNQYKQGSVKEFDDNWKLRGSESKQNYYTAGRPTNQIMMSFKNQWEVYRSFAKDFKPGIKALEPGSGRGSISTYFAANGFDTYLLDTSAEVLKVAEEIFKKNGLKAHYICEDALKTSFANDYFDVIVHVGLLEHFEDYQTALKEQYRILKPGGVIIANIIPKKWSVQKAFGFVNSFLKFVYWLLVKLNLNKRLNKEPKKPLYRNDYGSAVYVDVLKGLGADIEYQGGIFPVPSFSYSPEFPFTSLPPKIEKFLVWFWSGVLAIRKLLWPRRHPWLCSEIWGQSILVVARKP